MFWTDGFWPRIGGIETQACHFIHKMRQKGHHPLILAQIDGFSSKEDDWYGDVPIKRFDFNRIFPSGELYRLQAIEKYLEWVVKEFKPDIVHLNSCFGWNSFVFLLFRNLFCVPVVATIHSPYLYQNETNSLLEKICLQVDQIGCVSNWVLQETAKLVPAASSKLRLIYNGLPWPDPPPKGLSFSPPIFLMAGRLTIEKGFDTAIRAFSLLKGMEVQLLIVGDGEARPFLEGLVDELYLRDSVRFEGAVPKEEIYHRINRASAVLVPSYFESFGLIALEAMQMDRPVIASDVGGLKEIILPGKTGLLVPPHDCSALAHAIRFFLEEPERAVKMGKEGRKRACEMFTIQQNVEQYETIYQSLKSS